MNGHKPQEQSQTWIVFWNNRTKGKAEVTIGRWKEDSTKWEKLAGRLTRIFSREFSRWSRASPDTCQDTQRLFVPWTLTEQSKAVRKYAGKDREEITSWCKTNYTEGWGWRVRKSQRSTIYSRFNERIANSRLLCFFGSFKTLFHPLKSRRAAKKCHTCIMNKYVVGEMFVLCKGCCCCCCFGLHCAR